jgi:hypothetical protein
MNNVVHQVSIISSGQIGLEIAMLGGTKDRFGGAEGDFAFLRGRALCI